MPKGIYQRTKKHLLPIIRRNKSWTNRKRVSIALMGHGFSEETLKKMRENHADFSGKNNPNWRNNDVGKIGIHLWLSKNFKKKKICEFCGKHGNSFSVQWAKLKNKPYARLRENFIELCARCHKNYDCNKIFFVNGHVHPR